jgi:AcrR family transcriptional regulator
MTGAARREVIERAATELFSERGYHGASIDEIARRSGVTPPVVYDHFASKRDLHARLLERHRDDLLGLWDEYLPGDGTPEEMVPRAIEAWARYVEANPYAVKMFFRETTGDPEMRALHDEVQAQGRAALVPIMARVTGGGDEAALEMAVEIVRSGLTGLAIWWYEHPEVPREQVVAAALGVVWLGLKPREAGSP